VGAFQDQLESKFKKHTEYIVGAFQDIELAKNDSTTQQTHPVTIDQLDRILKKHTEYTVGILRQADKDSVREALLERTAVAECRVGSPTTQFNFVEEASGSEQTSSEGVLHSLKGQQKKEQHCRVSSEVNPDHYGINKEPASASLATNSHDENETPKADAQMSRRSTRSTTKQRSG